jgi:hypothetical protein
MGTLRASTSREDMAICDAIANTFSPADFPRRL